MPQIHVRSGPIFYQREKRKITIERKEKRRQASISSSRPLTVCVLTGKISSRKGFCLLCAMQRHVRTCFRERVTAMDPRSFVNNLKCEGFCAA